MIPGTIQRGGWPRRTFMQAKRFASVNFRNKFWLINHDEREETTGARAENGKKKTHWTKPRIGLQRFSVAKPILGRGSKRKRARHIHFSKTGKKNRAKTQKARGAWGTPLRESPSQFEKRRGAEWRDSLGSSFPFA